MKPYSTISGHTDNATGPHAAQWNSDSIRRIWDWYTTDPYTRERYFSYTRGEALTRFIAATGHLHGNFLDFGCGQGDLLAHMLDRDIFCYGADHSPQTLAKVSERFRQHPHWRDCRLIDGDKTGFASGFFDVITLVETLEHIPADRLPSLFAELGRLVKPDGIVVITTPHNEDLSAEIIYCPFCESVFHRWQHLHSFTVDSLPALISSHGFQSLFCQNIDLDQLVLHASLFPLRYLNPAKLAQWALRKGRIALDRLFPRPFPLGRTVQYCQRVGNRRHLCAVIKPIQLMGKSAFHPVQGGAMTNGQRELH
jgi:2-polyprenyl-3-methyl-5-hydroxy-6-metoxy-1,4-benzoquinol methylase